MRITGGSFGGRPIIAPKGMATRPTTDRVRESLFAILQHKDGFSFDGLKVIDLFAGSGALGLEAMSRGAAYCLFVDEAPAARAAIRTNTESLGLFGTTRIHRRSATALGVMSASAGGPFELAFLDPPYEKGLTGPALSALAGGWLSPSALCVVELSAREEMPDVPGFEIEDERRFGDTQIIFTRLR